MQTWLFFQDKRGPFWETYFICQKVFEKKSSKGQGDVERKNKEIIEIKSALIDVSKEPLIIGRGGQLRLWEKVDFYLFVSIFYDMKTDLLETKIYEVPKKILVQAFKDKLITYSNSHKTGEGKNSKGVKKSIKEIIKEKIEIGCSLPKEFSNYEISWKNLQDKNR